MNTSSIPQFPQRKRLTICDKEEIEHFTSRYPPYSDYNFTSLFCFNVDNKVEVSWLNGNLVVLFQDYTSDDLFFSFMGSNHVTETALTLLNYSAACGMKTELRLIPGHTRQLIQEEQMLQVNEDPNNHDYIVSVDSVSRYQGIKYRQKRSGVTKFLEQNPNSHTEILNVHTDAIKAQVTNLFLQWCNGKTDVEETEHELKAFKRLIDNSDHFELIVMGVYANNRLVQFTVCERIDKDTAVLHFEKHDPFVEGTCPFGIRELSRYLQQSNCVHMNLEQDLGLDGLRTSKRQFRPTGFLKKYTIQMLN